MKKRTPKADSIAQAASMLGVGVEKLRRAKRLGCPAFANGRVDLDVLRAWLVARAKKAPPTKAPIAGDGKPMPKLGAAAALRRLEEAEGSAWRELQAAVEAGDADETDRCRAGWLKISESLRHYDLAVEQNRRDSGELVQRSEIERALYALTLALKHSIHQSLCSLPPTLLGHTDPHEVYRILEPHFWEPVLASIAALHTGDKAGGVLVPGLRLPQWMLAAMTEPLSGFAEVKEHLSRLAAAVALVSEALIANTCPSNEPTGVTEPPANPIAPPALPEAITVPARAPGVIETGLGPAAHDKE